MDDQQASSSKQNIEIVKNVQGKYVTSGQRLLAFNIYSRHVQEGKSKSASIKITAMEVGLSERLLWQIVSEVDSSGKLQSPSTNRCRKDAFDKLDEDHKKTMRAIIHSFFLKTEIPTLDKILKIVQANETLPPMSRATLHRIMKKLGFVWETRGRNNMLMEKPEIIIWRRGYLNKIQQFRKDCRIIYYLDETWINAGHTHAKTWRDKTVKSTRQAFIEGLSVGLTNPIGRGKCFIIGHIGNENGFVENGLLMFESKKTGDHHEDMNSTVFVMWLNQILPLLQPNSVIVMDNIPYHSVKVEETPTTSWKKADIAKFLHEKGIESEERLLKVELLDLAKKYVLAHPIPYVVDEIVKKTGREVLRLPPYHCNLNPIELVLADVKDHVAVKNTTFKLADVRNLFQEGLHSVTPQNWAKCMELVIKEEENLYKLDNIMEQMELKFVVNTGSSDEDPEFSDSDQFDILLE